MISATSSPFNRDAFYIGGVLGTTFNGGATNWQGYGFSDQLTTTLANHSDTSVVTAGFLAGYQHRMESRPMIVSAEADINYLGNMRSNSSVTFLRPFGSDGNAPNGVYTLSSGRSSNYYGTVRGHLGYLVKDNIQLFVSGGFAYAGNSDAGDSTVTYTSFFGNTSSYTGHGSSQSHTGTVFGAGGEYALDTQMSVRLEYEYINLGNSNVTLTGPQGAQYYIVNNIEEHFSVLRLGVVVHY